MNNAPLSIVFLTNVHYNACKCSHCSDMCLSTAIHLKIWLYNGPKIFIKSTCFSPSNGELFSTFIVDYKCSFYGNKKRSSLSPSHPDSFLQNVV